MFMMFETIAIFDHLHQNIKVVTHMRFDNVDTIVEAIAADYERLSLLLKEMVRCLEEDPVNLPTMQAVNGSFVPSEESNTGQDGYEAMVKRLKEHIVDGDIIQAVPSQRIKRATTTHPFHVYRKLRGLNPSPYMFYMDVGDFQIVGASPEMLCKVEKGHVITHPIAGTRKRGKTAKEDDAIAAELMADVKERSEHIMLVDLGRNDVNRVCDPKTVKVDSLMHIERYRHVMHIVSHVSGDLRPDQTPFDAFRSIFPAGTVSGAPKVRAIQLVSECEQEKRGVYAGAVGYFSFSGDIDTAIAIRTILFKDGHAYLQAGAGIVYDSDPTMEYQETLSKLRSNMVAINLAEEEQRQTHPLPSATISTTDPYNRLSPKRSRKNQQ